MVAEERSFELSMWSVLGASAALSIGIVMWYLAELGAFT